MEINNLCIKNIHWPREMWVKWTWMIIVVITWAYNFSHFLNNMCFEPHGTFIVHEHWPRLTLRQRRIPRRQWKCTVSGMVHLYYLTPRQRPIQALIKYVQNQMEICIGLCLWAVLTPPHNFIRTISIGLCLSVCQCKQTISNGFLTHLLEPI